MEQLMQNTNHVRRSRYDLEGRDFLCGCGKAYLSEGALYTHIKTKHNGQKPEGTLNFRVTKAANQRTEVNQNLNNSNISIMNVQLRSEPIKNEETGPIQIDEFDAARILLNNIESRRMLISQKLDLTSVDFDKVPQIIQENYLKAGPKKQLSSKQFRKIVKASENFVSADLLDVSMKKNKDKSLMQDKMFLSCIYPCDLMCEQLEKPVRSKWPAKQKQIRQNTKYIQQLKYKVSCVSPVNFCSVKHNYSPMLFARIYEMLKETHVKYEDVASFMQHYGITPKFLTQSLSSLQYGSIKKLLSTIETLRIIKLKLACENNSEKIDLQ